MFKLYDRVVTVFGPGKIVAINGDEFEVDVDDGETDSFTAEELVPQFKLHEKSRLRLNCVMDKRARQTQMTLYIPMFFEYQEEPTESYHLPNEYYPTHESIKYAFASYYGFPPEMVTLDGDEYGDLRIVFCGKPHSNVWWDLTDV